MATRILLACLLLASQAVAQTNRIPKTQTVRIADSDDDSALVSDSNPLPVTIAGGSTSRWFS